MSVRPYTAARVAPWNGGVSAAPRLLRALPAGCRQALPPPPQRRVAAGAAGQTQCETLDVPCTQQAASPPASEEKVAGASATVPAGPQATVVAIPRQSAAAAPPSPPPSPPAAAAPRPQPHQTRSSKAPSKSAKGQATRSFAVALAAALAPHITPADVECAIKACAAADRRRAIPVRLESWPVENLAAGAKALWEVADCYNRAARQRAVRTAPELLTLPKDQLDCFLTQLMDFFAADLDPNTGSPQKQSRKPSTAALQQALQTATAAACRHPRVLLHPPAALHARAAGLAKSVVKPHGGSRYVNHCEVARRIIAGHPALLEPTEKELTRRVAAMHSVGVRGKPEYMRNLLVVCPQLLLTEAPVAKAKVKLLRNCLKPFFPSYATEFLRRVPDPSIGRLMAQSPTQMARMLYLEQQRVFCSDSNSGRGHNGNGSDSDDDGWSSTDEEEGTASGGSKGYRRINLPTPFWQVISWPDARFSREAPGFAAWLDSEKEALQRRYRPLKFAPPAPLRGAAAVAAAAGTVGPQVKGSSDGNEAEGDSGDEKAEVAPSGQPQQAAVERQQAAREGHQQQTVAMGHHQRGVLVQLSDSWDGDIIDERKVWV